MPSPALSRPVHRRAYSGAQTAHCVCDTLSGHAALADMTQASSDGKTRAACSAAFAPRHSPALWLLHTDGGRVVSRCTPLAVHQAKAFILAHLSGVTVPRRKCVAHGAPSRAERRVAGSVQARTLERRGTGDNVDELVGLSPHPASASLSSLRAAPLTMVAWRPRLYCICRLLIMSPAFFEALSMALRFELISAAWPSTSAA